ncbi:MAG: hypothetical protein P8M71_03420 [Pseudomonadales bacterium]|nr:hypothetical protein [Pseudomonadales bacterium]
MNDRLSGYLFFKVILVWLTLSLVGFFWGKNLVSLMTPFYAIVTEAVSTDYVAAISVEESQVDSVVLSATTIRAREISPLIKPIAAGKTLQSSAGVLHTLVPIVIFLTIVLSWPVKSLKQLLWIVLFSVPSFFCISALTTPIQLLGLIEMAFQDYAIQNNLDRDPLWVLHLNFLNEGGFRWFLAASFALACGAISEKMIKNNH